MKNKMKKIILIAIVLLIFVGLIVAVFTIFFDQAVLVRKDTLYRVPIEEKVVALTFDDGPSPVWTPQILDKLKKENVKATFFLLGEHVQKYPQVARRIVAEGHEVGNHSLSHHVLIAYKKQELQKEIRDAEKVIKDITGKTTKYFRPPKAWLTKREKKKVKEMGYEVVLWSLNSKDWVTFDDKYMLSYLMHHIQPGDIILFHDSGGAFSAEGGDRHETVLVIPRLIEKLKERGYRFVTVSELIKLSQQEKK